MKTESRIPTPLPSERVFLLAGAVAVTGLGLAIAGASGRLVVALIVVSASVLLAGFAVEIAGFLRPRSRGLEAAPLSRPSEAGDGPKEWLLAPLRWLGALKRLASRALSSRGGLALAALLIVSVAAVGLGRGLPATASQPQTREFEIDAAQFHYSPSIIRVDKGDRVVIKFRATDVSHGMYVDGYGVEVSANPGRTQTLEFVADRAGKYQFRCSQTCGSLHPFMIGWLVVRSNGPFTASLGLIALVAVGTVAFVWFGKGSRDD